MDEAGELFAGLVPCALSVFGNSGVQVPPSNLMEVNDKRVLKLIRTFLNAGVMDNGLVSPTDEGVPQAGPLSPLLSNLREMSYRRLWQKVMPWLLLTSRSVVHLRKF